MIFSPKTLSPSWHRYLPRAALSIKAPLSPREEPITPSLFFRRGGKQHQKGEKIKGMWSDRFPARLPASATLFDKKGGRRRSELLGYTFARGCGTRTRPSYIKAAGANARNVSYVKVSTLEMANRNCDSSHTEVIFVQAILYF